MYIKFHNFIIKIKYKFLHFVRVINKHTLRKLNVLYQIRRAKVENKLNPINKEQNTFAFYRILGNDLPPRHEVGQTKMNLEFILKNEDQFDNCIKIYVLNRIFNKKHKDDLIKLIRENNNLFLEIPFEEDEYEKCSFEFSDLPYNKIEEIIFWDFAKKRFDVEIFNYILIRKNRYVMNINGAKNYALDNGKLRAKWVMPWDGNCYLQKTAWFDIIKNIEQKEYLKYFIVPMARVPCNENLLNVNATFQANEEPQIIFRKDAVENFNEIFPYGRQNKVELLKRIGVQGRWDNWTIKISQWSRSITQRSPELYQFDICGWVARLHSGNKAAEEKSSIRKASRDLSIINFLTKLDLSQFEQKYNQSQYTFINQNIISEHNSISSIITIEKLKVYLTTEYSFFYENSLDLNTNSILEKISTNDKHYEFILLINNPLINCTVLNSLLYYYSKNQKYSNNLEKLVVILSGISERTFQYFSNNVPNQAETLSFLTDLALKQLLLKDSINLQRGNRDFHSYLDNRVSEYFIEYSTFLSKIKLSINREIKDLSALLQLEFLDVVLAACLGEVSKLYYSVIKISSILLLLDKKLDRSLKYQKRDTINSLEHYFDLMKIIITINIVYQRTFQYNLSELKNKKNKSVLENLMKRLNQHIIYQAKENKLSIHKNLLLMNYMLHNLYITDKMKHTDEENNFRHLTHELDSDTFLWTLGQI